MIKKSLSVLLVLSFLLLLCSCGNDVSEDETTVPDTEETSQELEDPDFYPLSDVLTFSDGTDNYVMPKNSILMTDESGHADNVTTDDADIAEFDNCIFPFGYSTGDNVSDICRKLNLKKGYAIYGNVGEKPNVYDPDAEIDFSDGKNGALYFGYKVMDDECASIDSDMLEYIVTGALISNYDFDVVLCILTFNDNEELRASCVVYSDYNAFTDIMN